MERLTASPSGECTDNSIRLRTNSDNQITLQLNYLTTPIEISYQICGSSGITKTLAGGGIVIDDNGSYTITISESDNLKGGVYRHYVTITNDTGTYKAALDKGRVRVED